MEASGSNGSMRKSGSFQMEKYQKIIGLVILNWSYKWDHKHPGMAVGVSQEKIVLFSLIT